MFALCFPNISKHFDSFGILESTIYENKIIANAKNASK